MNAAAARQRFAELHRAGCFVLPNAWDLGSAKILQYNGSPAIATTSSGYAAALGRQDTSVGLEELLWHVEALAEELDVPVSVDAERGYGDDPAGVAEAVERLAGVGAAGISIEDYNPATDGFDPIEVSVERVGAAAEAAHREGMLLTARADHGFHLPIDDALVDEVITRLAAYRDAGADVLYAPGLDEPQQLQRLVGLGLSVSVLIRPRGGPSVPELERAGVRRVSTGGSLAFAAYAALQRAAEGLLQHGTADFDVLSAEQRRAFD